MGYLYNEILPPDRARLEAHLERCAQCRASVSGWRNTMGALDEYQLPAQTVPTHPIRTALKRGIAASVVLAIGFALGRAASPAGGNREEMRAAIKSEVRAAMLAEARQREAQWTDFKNAWEAKYGEDAKLALDAIARVDANRLANYASLREELETVALHTKAGLQQAQQEIVSLAGNAQPDGPPLNP